MPKMLVAQIRGLIGKILDIIKSMYKPPNVSLIHQDKISQTFLTTIGLKQSDVLRAILFNIYINDLPRRLPQNSRYPDIINDIPYLHDTKINNLLFADGLAIAKTNINIRKIKVTNGD